MNAKRARLQALGELVGRRLDLSPVVLAWPGYYEWRGVLVGSMGEAKCMYVAANGNHEDRLTILDPLAYSLPNITPDLARAALPRAEDPELWAALESVLDNNYGPLQAWVYGSPA